VFIPTQKLVFLGFVLDSVSMLVYLAPDKALKLKKNETKPQLLKLTNGILMLKFPSPTKEGKSLLGGLTQLRQHLTQ